MDQQKDVISLEWELDAKETERMCPQCYHLRHISQFEKSVTVAYLLNLPASVTWCTSCREGS